MAKEKRSRKESRRDGKHKRKKRRRSRSRSSSGSGRAPSPRRLLLAAALGDKQQCRELIQQGADVAYADAEGTTALHEVRLLECGVLKPSEVLLLPGPVAFAMCRCLRLPWQGETVCSSLAHNRRAGTVTCPLPSCCCGVAATRGWGT